MSNAAVLTPGTLFAGQFRVVRPIQEGGMGSVHEVEQVGTGYHRALKIMHPQLAQDARARERFTQEAQVGARIESEHVVQVVASGIDGSSGTPWLAMELLRGSDLAAVLKQRGALPPAEVAEIFRQLCHALAAAHRAGIVHRDLKLENIYLAESRRSDTAYTVKVLDFGIAKWIQECGTAAAFTAVVGSPLWMAPEQLDPHSPVTPATDVWALGLVAYQLLTGRSYWTTASTEPFSMQALLGEIAVQPLVSATQRAAAMGRAQSLPFGFDGWFARCVDRNPAVRFAEAGACSAALVGVLGGDGSSPGSRPGGVPIAPTVVAGPFPPGQPSGAVATPWSPGGPGYPPVAPAVPPVPPWQPPVPATAGPFPPPGSYGAGAMPFLAEPPRRTLGPMIAGAMAMVMLAGGVGAYIALRPACEVGEHDSRGHCCVAGADWSSAESRCVCASPSGCGAVSVVIPPVADAGVAQSLPPPDPLGTGTGEPGRTVPTAGHPCLGTFRGALSESTGSQGEVTVSMQATEGPVCGSWQETWPTAGGACQYQFTGCALDPDGDKVRGTGISQSPGCASPLTVSLLCTHGRVVLHEDNHHGIVTTARLDRQ